MGEVNSAVMAFEQVTETFTQSQECGTLKGATKDYSVLLGGGPEAEAVEQLFDQTELPDRPEYLNDSGCEFEAEWISPESLAIQEETENLLEELQNLDASSAEENAEMQNASQAKQASKEQSKTSSEKEASSAQRESVSIAQKKEAQSIFSLSRMMGASQGKTIFSETKTSREIKDSFQSKVAVQQQPKQTIIENFQANREDNDSQKDREQKDRDSSDQDEEGFGNPQQQREREENQRRFKKKAAITEGIKLNKKTAIAEEPAPVPRVAEKSEKPLEGMSCIFIRFMALMARILSQAEADAHELYQRIKARTDDIDTLTLLISKINSAKGDIDWTKDEEMKKLVEKVRAMGVDIPKDKFKWKEDEKKLLKENIQMKKDSMEKVTQLERTDMQRYLQEASQCHQARSNVLKLLKEVMDTIIHNMRPS